MGPIYIKFYFALADTPKGPSTLGSCTLIKILGRWDVRLCFTPTSAATEAVPGHHIKADTAAGMRKPLVCQDEASGNMGYQGRSTVGMWRAAGKDKISGNMDMGRIDRIVKER